MFVRRLLFACVVSVICGTLPGGAAQSPAPALLADVPAGASLTAVADVATRPDTVRARATRVNMAALDADQVDVAVTSDLTLRVELTARSTNPDRSESWSGRIAGEPLSAATFVRAGSVLQGSLRTLASAYSIEPIGTSGYYVVREVDAGAAREELHPPVPDLRADSPSPVAGDEPPMAGDDGSLFDVLVVYTPAARDEAGGDAAIRARINLGVTETNTAYANSGVIPRLRLVGSELVNYTESGDLYADLQAVTGTSDGQMDTVHARRNALGADLVKLVVSTNTSACGIAWLMTSLATPFAGNAFSVTSYPCISPNYTFGHELGHNMGSNHAPGDDGGGATLYAYSFGYKHPGNLFRTVMAYNCSGSGCPRVLYFSNPSAYYNGLPTGTVAQHNNALSINNARSTIANWRQAVSSNTAPTITTIANRTTPEDTPTPAIAFTVADAETSAGSLVVTATSSNTTLVANTTAALALGGSGGSRTLVVTPQPDASGASTITVTVSDGSLSASAAFQVTVSSVNDAPVISAIAPQTTIEDQSVAVPFTVSDAETAAGALVVQAASSNAAVVSASGIGLGGSGGSRIVTLTPGADATGVTTITLWVTDGTLTSERTFTLTVTAADDPPAFVSLPPLVSTTIGVPVSVDVTVSDPDTAGTALSLSVTSANTSLLPPDGIAIAPTGSSASTRTFRVTLSPSPGQLGTSALTVTAGDGVSVTSLPVAFNVTAVTSPPDAPTALAASASGTTVTLSWTPALTGSAPSSFTVEIGTAAGTTTLPTRSVAWPTTTLTIVLPEGTYYARVRGVNGMGTSGPSPEASVVVSEPSPIPGPPGNFWARTVGRTVSFTWTASVAGEPATSYTIEAGSAPGLSNLAQLATGSDRTSFDVPNVPAGTYWVRVRGSNAAGTGAPSQDVAIVMGASSGCVGLPGAPVLLTPVVTGNNVALDWNPPGLGGLVTGYVLMAGSAPGASDLAYFGTGSAATAFAASAPGGLYYVRVAASNACGVGPASNEVSFSLGSTLPGAPVDFAATVSAGGHVSLTWAPPAEGVSPTSYLIEAGSTAGASDLAMVSTGAPITSFTATAPPGTYYVRVRAVNGAGPGPASSEIVVVVP